MKQDLQTFSNTHNKKQVTTCAITCGELKIEIV